MSQLSINQRIRPARGASCLRALQMILPLGRYYHPLFAVLNRPHGLVAIDVGGGSLTLPASWRKQVTRSLLVGSNSAPEFKLIETLCRRLQHGHLIDVGANVGLYTLRFRQVSALPIIAYEPEPFLFKLLESNIAFNRLPNVTARPVACGSKPGQVLFNDGTNGSVALGSNIHSAITCDAGDIAAESWDEQARRVFAGKVTITVPVVTLDDDLAAVEKVGLLKIDCEGFEYEILLGAKQLLEKHRPALFVEVHPAQLARFGSSTAALLALLEPTYQLEFWSFSRPTAVSRLGQSLAKFKPAQPVRYPDAERMLEATVNMEASSQFYWIGTPR